MTPRQSRSPTSRSLGFTLVEVIVAVSIMSIVMLFVFRFFITTLNLYSYDHGRVQVNQDIRSFTNEIRNDATTASYFYIYPSFSSRWTGTGNTTDAHVSESESGDMLVLVYDYTNPGSGNTGATTYITRLVGYYRNATSTSNGPVMRFDVTLSPAVNATSTTIAALLDANVPVSTASNNTTVIQLAQGLSNGTLFYNFYDHSAMVNGQIYESGSEQQQAVNTYNFTVSPD